MFPLSGRCPAPLENADTVKSMKTYVCLEGPVFPYTKAKGLVD